MSLSVAVIKYADKNNLRGKSLFGLPFHFTRESKRQKLERTAHIFLKFKVPGYSSSGQESHSSRSLRELVTSCPQLEKKRTMNK